MFKIKEWFSHHHEDNAMEGQLTQKHYTNPYLIGLLLGLVLLSAFLIMGRGLGASGVLSTTVSVAVDKIAPSHTENNEFYQGLTKHEREIKLKSLNDKWKAFHPERKGA